MQGSAGPAGLPGLGAFNSANLGNLMSNFQGPSQPYFVLGSWIEAGCGELELATYHVSTTQHVMLTVSETTVLVATEVAGCLDNRGGDCYSLWTLG